MALTDRHPVGCVAITEQGRQGTTLQLETQDQRQGDSLFGSGKTTIESVWTRTISRGPGGWRSGKGRPLAVLGMSMVIAALNVGSASAVSSSEELWSVQPAQGSGAEEAFGPGGAATDPINGHIYVSDPDNSRILEYTPWGEFVKAFGWNVAPGSVNEQQEIRLRAASGQFRLAFEGSTTSDLTLETGAKGPAAAATLKAALDALPSIGGTGGEVEVAVSQGTADGQTPYVYVVTFKGALAGINVEPMTILPGTEPLTGGKPTTVDEVQTRANGNPPSGGLEDCTAESGCQAGGTIGATGINGEAGLLFAGGNLYVSESRGSRVQEFNPAGEFVRTFGGDVISDGATGTGSLSSGSTKVTAVQTTSRFFEVGQMVSGAGIQPGTTIVALDEGTINLSQAATATASGVAIAAPEGSGNVPANERQTFSFGSPAHSTELPTGGTFTLTFETPDPSPSSARTTAIPFEATAAEVESSLVALPNLEPADVKVTGAAGGPWTVEFTGPRYGDSAPPRLGVDTSELTPKIPSGDFFEEYTTKLEMQTAPEVCANLASCRSAVSGSGEGEFHDPVLAMTERGTSGIYVGDHQRIQTFGLDGVVDGSLELPEERAEYLSSTPGGSLWAGLSKEGNQSRAGPVELDGTTGAQLAKIELEASLRSAATDAAGNVYFSGQKFLGPGLNNREPGEVFQYSSSPKPLNPPTCCTVPVQASGEPYLIQPLATNDVGDLFVTYSGRSGANLTSLYKLFGPGPVTFEAPPAAPPTITSQAVESVQATEARVTGNINPRFWLDTRYYVEYGTGRCSAGECTATKPVPPGTLLSNKVSGSPVKVPGLIIEGLQPETEYHYRLVAVSSGGGPVAGIGGTPGAPGRESSFTTLPLNRQPQSSCPNAAFRTGFSAPLPDCRAYEMVSPIDKNGGNVKTLLNEENYTNSVSQSSTAGDSFTFSSYRAFADPEGAAMTNQYLATRGADGWGTASITPRQSVHNSGLGYQLSVAWDNMYRAFSPDLCQSWLYVASDPPLAPSVNAAHPALYRRDACAGGVQYEALAQAEAPNPALASEVELLGASADGAESVIRSAHKVNPEEEEEKVTENGNGVSRSYYIKNGKAHFLCVLPDGSHFEGDCAAGTTSVYGGLIGEGRGNRVASVTHAISADGSKVYWTAVAERAAFGVKEEGSGQLYLRVDPAAEEGCGETGMACTLPVSGTVSTSSARFVAASADGSRALFEFVQGPQNGKLYEFEVEADASRLVAKKSLGYVGGSEDLSSIYFVSEEKLAGTKGAKAGEPNLYLEELGSTPRFIVTLAPLDAGLSQSGVEIHTPSDVNPAPVAHFARTTPDGKTLAFLSVSPLTGYDNTDASSPLPCGVSEVGRSGICDSEVFLYHAESGSTVCVSCDPSGALPEGRPGLAVNEASYPDYISGELTRPTTQFYMPRNLSDDGERVFFNSYGALVPRDTDGREDVYEWEAASGVAQCEAEGAEVYARASGGCLSLISSGTSPSDTEFLDADPEGKDVFIDTDSSLLPQDPGLYDVYDARIGGGFLLPTPAASCEGEACQGPLSPPIHPTPASSTYEGPGNVKRKGSAKNHKGKSNKKPNHRKKRRGRSTRTTKTHDRRSGR